jgi:ABC-type transport system involved in resistance to organic solvents, permease component
MLRLVALLGGWCIGALRDVGAITLLFTRSITAALHSGVRYRREVIRQMYFVGVESIPVILITGTFAGAVFAYTIYNQLAALGVGSWAGAFMIKMLTWHFGPVLMGLVLAGRVGCSFTAEIGTMNVTEQIDALRSFGVSATSYLVMPRVVAALVMTPILTAFTIFVGVMAGMFMIVNVMGGESHYQWKTIQEMMIPYDYVQGMLKSVVFGVIIALICCRNGINTRGGAEGVGQATTQANVNTCIAILIVNLGVSVVLTKAEPLWDRFVQVLNTLG